MSARKKVPQLRSVVFEGLENRQLFAVTLATAAADTYIYGVAPVVANITEQVATNVSNPNGANEQAPINQFANSPNYPAPGNGVFVRPNADTLYSTAWLDLSKGPLVFQIPPSNGTYEIYQFLDAYTKTFASIGTRTTGEGAQSYLIAGPTWKGTVPPGLTLITAPSNTVWIVGRIAVEQDANGNPIYGPVNSIQSQLSLTPLASYTPGGTYIPPTNVPVTSLSPGLSDSVTANQNLANLNAQEYFTLLSQVLKVNPPPAADGPVLQDLADFNLAPGQHFNWNTLTTDQQSALTTAFGNKGRGASFQTSNAAVTPAALSATNNWNETLQDGSIGTFGTNYSARAAVATGGLGANLVEDAVYPSTSVDSTGTALSGANTYDIHFAANQLPPVPASAFWSLTVYNSSGYFVANPINRYSTGSLHPELQYNSDGSLDIYLSNTEPPSGTSNWLPIPTGGFNLTLRLYDPEQALFTKAWVPPAVVNTGPATSSPSADAAAVSDAPATSDAISAGVFADKTPITDRSVLEDQASFVLGITFNLFVI